MKTHSLLLIAILLGICPILSMAQENMQSGIQHDSANSKFNNQKGKFHVAIQNFGIGLSSDGLSGWSLSSRVGYMITNNDMIYLSGQFAHFTGLGTSTTIESSLYYRRYFGNMMIRSFIQSGVGIGFQKNSGGSYENYDPNYYGLFSVGTGVALQYRRWGFEAGIQSEYNQNFSGRIVLKPIFGISFSF